MEEKKYDFFTILVRNEQYGIREISLKTMSLHERFLSALYNSIYWKMHFSGFQLLAIIPNMDIETFFKKRLPIWITSDFESFDNKEGKFSLSEYMVSKGFEVIKKDGKPKKVRRYEHEEDSSVVSENWDDQ